VGLNFGAYSIYMLARCRWSLSLYLLIAVYQFFATSGQAIRDPEANSLDFTYVEN